MALVEIPNISMFHHVRNCPVKATAEWKMSKGLLLMLMVPYLCAASRGATAWSSLRSREPERCDEPLVAMGVRLEILEDSTAREPWV